MLPWRVRCDCMPSKRATKSAPRNIGSSLPLFADEDATVTDRLLRLARGMVRNAETVVPELEKSCYAADIAQCNNEQNQCVTDVSDPHIGAYDRRTIVEK